MKEKLEAYLKKNTQMSITLWMVVGGYLIYLAWQIVSSDFGDASPALLIAAVVVFVLAGGVLIAAGLYAFIKKCYKDPTFVPSDNDPSDGER